MYFNVKSCPDLLQVIGLLPDSTKESSRICRPCKRNIQSSVKTAQAAQLVLENITKHYQDGSKAAKLCGCASVRVKRQLQVRRTVLVNVNECVRAQGSSP